MGLKLISVVKEAIMAWTGLEIQTRGKVMGVVVIIPMRSGE